MSREKTLDSIPNDLFLEIFSRLPTKSVGRCRCVSKQWASILGRQDFTELFLTRSSTRPRLLFALERANGEWLFFSSPHPQNPYVKSIVVTVDFHTKFPKSRSHYCNYASGLLYFPDSRISKNKYEPLICNPLTGQCAILPKLRTGIEPPRSFLGFDPIDKQFKVLLINNRVKNETVHHILTLGAGIERWRNIKCCPPTHKPLGGAGICINGVLYYVAVTDDMSYVIVCFDVRSEKLKFLHQKFFYYYELINYKGKLGGVRFKYDNDHSTWNSQWRTRDLCMCVLEDVEKEEWSVYVYPFPENEKYYKLLNLIGITATGEIILTLPFRAKPYVFYFSPEKNTVQCVKLQGVGVNLEELILHGGNIFAFVDHVEDLSGNFAKQLKSSIYDLGISGLFDALCRLGDD